MDFKDPKISIYVRVGLLTATIFILSGLILDDGFIITILVFLILLGFQIFSLTKFLRRGNEELVSFLDSIRHDDITYSYKTDSDNENINKLNNSLNNVLKNLREVRKEKDADFQYLKNIVQHIGIGLITFKSNGKIQIMNTAAKKLLKVNQADNVDELSVVSDKLVDIFKKLRTGGRDLLRLEIGGDIVQLAVYAIELTLRGDEFKLVSIQNIQSELEEKEMEAWQNLVRVLTHEIMNSVTPISSLANTVEVDLNTQLANGKDVNTMSNEEVEDIHLAIQTIKKRSQGLIRFVQDFRNLTHIPKPKIKDIKVKRLLNELIKLLHNEIESREVKLNVRIDPEDLTIQADKELIEQVLINIIQNALQSFDDQTNRLVEISAYVDEKSRPIISVKDNGNGIEEEALEKIFIPFFTTKKNGSGIGLSLSRQIMRQHQGLLGVKTKLDEGTEFFLRF